MRHADLYNVTVIEIAAVEDAGIGIELVEEREEDTLEQVEVVEVVGLGFGIIYEVPANSYLAVSMHDGFEDSWTELSELYQLWQRNRWRGTYDCYHRYSEAFEAMAEKYFTPVSWYRPGAFDWNTMRSLRGCLEYSLKEGRVR